MTDATKTRSRVMEEQMAALTDRHDSMMAKVDTLCTSLHQQAELVETMQKSLALQQSVMTDLMVKLTKLERVTTPPLLPAPPGPQEATIQPYSGPSPSRPSHAPTVPHPPKLEVPLFTGDNVLDWLFQIEHFFTHHHIPSDQRVDIVAFYMTGTALQWFHWLSSTQQLSTWANFSRQAELRFGPSSFINPEAANYSSSNNSPQSPLTSPNSNAYLPVSLGLASPVC